jgi:hypothetical protein
MAVTARPAAAKVVPISLAILAGLISRSLHGAVANRQGSNPELAGPPRASRVSRAHAECPSIEGPNLASILTAAR